MTPRSRNSRSVSTRAGSLPLSTTVMSKGTSCEVRRRARSVSRVAPGRLNTGMVTLQTGATSDGWLWKSCSIIAPLRAHAVRAVQAC